MSNYVLYFKPKNKRKITFPNNSNVIEKVAKCEGSLGECIVKMNEIISRKEGRTPNDFILEKLEN